MNLMITLEAGADNLNGLSELGLSSEVIALARGMLLGDKSMLDPKVIQDFRASGMSHLLAVSGLHVGIIMSLVWWLLRPIEALVCLVTPPHMVYYYTTGIVKRLLVILITWCYVGAIGAPMSAVRAALMLSLCLLGWMFHRPVSTWNCLLLAALILIAFDPWCVTMVGFQLSFLAVAGILSFQPWLQESQTSWWMRLILLSVSAQWFTLPVVAYYFHQVPFLGWLQGLMVVPFVSFFIILLIAGAVFPCLHWLSVLIEALYGWITWSSQSIARLEHLLLGGHLYFYPSLAETLLAELFFLSVILYLRVRHTNQLIRTPEI